jgi:L-lysine 6-transaminase
MIRVPHEFSIVQDEQLIEQVAEKSEYLIAGLMMLQDSHPEKVSNIRGAGLYQGFTTPSKHHKADILQRALLQENMLLLGAGVDSIRFRPNLNVTKDDIDLMLVKLDRILRT